MDSQPQTGAALHARNGYRGHRAGAASEPTESATPDLPVLTAEFQGGALQSGLGHRYHLLTLRGEVNGLKLTQSIKSTLQRVDIQFGFERKVVRFRGAFQHFQFDITAQAGKEMIGLGDHRMRR